MVTVKAKRLVEVYFKVGLTHDEILCFLALRHKIIISKRTLQRICKQLSLQRRKNYSDILEVAAFINEQMQGCGKLHGYRWMHLRCIQSGLNIPRDHVYVLLQILDPEGVQVRKRNRLKRRQYKSKGPNNVWHLDGYDKLKPFGICIHGCIDGFSRKVLWIEANSTNSDPKVVAGYFISNVLEAGGCPERVRADMGTENSYVRDMQLFLRRHHEDTLAGESSFMYGKSVYNQRIEWFWGTVRKKMCQYWMDIFKDLQGEDVFVGSFLDKNILQFCFMDIIQKDLDSLRKTWNCHVISPQRNSTRQGNRPIMMYLLPQLYDKVDCLCSVDADEVTMCEEETLPKSVCDETINELCILFMEERGLNKPTDGLEGKHLYLELRRCIMSEI